MIINYKRYFSYLVILFACISLIYISTANCGIGISPDSAHYISIAKNILPEHNFLSSITGWDDKEIKNWNALWPPLYPIIIVVPVLLRNYFNDFPFIILNGILLFITILLSVKLFKRLVNSDKIIYPAGIILIVFSKWFFWIYCFVWSETVFIPLVLVNLLLFDNFMKSKSDRDFYLLLGSILALSLTRYIGVFFFFPLIYFGFRNRFLINRLRLSALIVSTVPLLIYLLMNYYYTNTLLGIRAKAEISWLDLAYRLIEGINLYIFGYRPAVVLQYVTASLFIFIICFFLIRVWNTKNELNRLILITCFLQVGAVFIFASSSRLEKISFRYFSPVFIPVALLVISSMLSVFRKKLALVIILILSVSSGMITIGSVYIYRHNGVGCFSAIEWKNSEIIDFIKRENPNRIIYSNYPDAINYFTNKPAKLITGEEEKLPEMLEKIRLEKGILIILNKTTFRITVDKKILFGMLGKQKSIQLSDGKIYFF
jgi:hypothetical protein